jgi:hypothetical protein
VLREAEAPLQNTLENWDGVVQHAPDDRVRPPELDLELLEETVVHDLIPTKRERDRVDVIKHWWLASLRNGLVVPDEVRARSRADVEKEEERHAEKLRRWLPAACSRGCAPRTRLRESCAACS